jgi:Kef-type K+ transport system membrane component KefB
VPATHPVPLIASHQLVIFLLQCGTLLLLAYVLGRLALRMKMPAIVGELCAGVLAGPSVLAHLAPSVSAWLLPRDPAQLHLLDAVGQIGVLLLVGITGIQMDLGLLRRKAVPAVAVGVGGLIVPLGAGIGVGLLLPAMLVPAHAARGTFALFVGVAIGVSALPVIAKTLFDLGLLHHDIGQLILSAVSVDDTLGWLLLAVVSAMATGQVSAAGIGRIIGGVALVIVAAIAARPLVRTSLQAAASRPDSGPTAALVIIMVLLAAAGSQALGLEAVFGAFVCGLIISSCGGVDRVRLAPLRVTVLSVLAPLYFATAGLRMDLTALARPAVLLAGVVILAVAVITKFAGAYAGARLSRLGHWQALALGAGLNSRGVVEIIVATVGLQLGLLSQAMFTIIVLVAIATSLMAPPLLRRAATRIGWTADELAHTDLQSEQVPQQDPAATMIMGHTPAKPGG